MVYLMMIVESNNRPALEEECGSLDDDELSESRLVGQDSDDVTNEQHPLHELTLQQWVGRCKLKFMGRDTMQTEPDQMLGFTKAALPIVLKLTDFLIEAEKDEQNGKVNPVPLESIVAGNVIIRSKEPDAMRSGEEQKELIDYVWIMSSMGDNQYDPNAGTVMARLCAMGNVLCELFVGDETNSTLEGMSSHDGAAVGCIHLDEEDDNRPRKRSSRMKSTFSEDTSANCIARLASKGFPYWTRVY